MTVVLSCVAAFWFVWCSFCVVSGLVGLVGGLVGVLLGLCKAVWGAFGACSGYFWGCLGPSGVLWGLVRGTFGVV